MGRGHNDEVRPSDFGTSSLATQAAERFDDDPEVSVGSTTVFPAAVEPGALTDYFREEDALIPS